MRKLLLYNGFSNLMLEIVVWMIYLKSQGWTITQIALLEGFFTICQVIFELPSGLISDRIGHKKALLLGETLCFIYLLAYFVPKIHILLYISFLLFALGLALISGTDISLLYESLSSKEKQNYLKYASVFTAVGVLATALGNFSGGWIAQYSWTLLFILGLSGRAIAFLLCTQIDTKNLITTEEDSKTFKLLLAELRTFFLREKKALPLLATTCFSATAVTISYQYGPLILETLKLNVSLVSTIFGILSFLGAIAVFFTYRLSKIIQEDFLVWSLQSVSLVLFALFLEQKLSIILLSLVSVNVVYEIWNVILENKLQALAYANVRATIISVSNLMISALLTTASFLIGALGERIALVNIVGCLNVFLLASALLSFYLYQKLA